MPGYCARQIVDARMRERGRSRVQRQLRPPGSYFPDKAGASMTESAMTAEDHRPERVRESIPLLIGRRWVLQKLAEWWDHGAERLFLITGDPGTGKSMIMAWLRGFGPEPEDTIRRAQLARLRD